MNNGVSNTTVKKAKDKNLLHLKSLISSIYIYEKASDPFTKHNANAELNLYGFAIKKALNLFKAIATLWK